MRWQTPLMQWAAGGSLPSARPLHPRVLQEVFDQHRHWLTTQTDYVGRLADGPFPHDLVPRIMALPNTSTALGGRAD